MTSLYEQLLAAKGAPKAAGAPNSSQLRKAPMSLRSAMRKYAEGGDVSTVVEDTDVVPYIPEQLAQPIALQPQPNVQMDLGTGREANAIDTTPSQTSPNNVLSGNIMAGASWNSLNPTLADQLTQATGQSTLNTAVGGATTEDTLNQLNDFLSSGGSFAPGANVFLQTGGVDLVNGVDRNTVENNIDQIISTLESQGANVVLTGSPYAASFSDVQSNNFNPELDSIYGNIAGRHKNVALVDSMGRILQDKSLLSDPIHPNKQGWEIYNQSVLDALKSLKG